MKKAKRLVLVIRLSSLGDILLATSFLENLPDGVQVDWIVRSEFEFALHGHPKIHRLIPFQKRSGLKGWFELVRSLKNEPYETRVDLHHNLRSLLALGYFRILDAKSSKWVKHLRVSKERVRTLLYFGFKNSLPKVLRPTPYWIRFGRVGLQTSQNTRVKSRVPAPPSYLPVLLAAGHDEKRVLSEYDVFQGKYFVVMPAASFRNKEWDARRYCELIERSMTGLTPVLVGRESDPACLELRAHFKQAGVFFKDLLAEPDFKKTAILIKYAQFYLGSDTGLAHLAEAVGTPSYVIFGPTRPDLGFGPWRPESKAISLPLACSPCNKDGSFCYRFSSPYACLKKLEVHDVKRQIQSS